MILVYCPLEFNDKDYKSILASKKYSANIMTSSEEQYDIKTCQSMPNCVGLIYLDSLSECFDHQYKLYLLNKKAESSPIHKVNKLSNKHSENTNAHITWNRK